MRRLTRASFYFQLALIFHSVPELGAVEPNANQFIKRLMPPSSAMNFPHLLPSNSIPEGFDVVFSYSD